MGACRFDQRAPGAGRRHATRTGVRRVGGGVPGQAHESPRDVELLVFLAHPFEVDLEHVGGGVAEGGSHRGADAGNGDEAAQRAACHGQEFLRHALEEPAQGAPRDLADRATDFLEEVAEELVQLLLGRHTEEFGGEVDLVGLAEHAGLAGVTVRCRLERLAIGFELRAIQIVHHVLRVRRAVSAAAGWG